MSSILNDATPYGLKALRKIRDKREPSKRLSKKISQTYDYFLQKVDPIVGACITHLLCEQPADILKAMVDYLSARKNNIHVVSKVSENNDQRPRKELKVFLATSIGPVIAKIVNRIALERPDDVIDFMTIELNKMIALEAEESQSKRVATEMAAVPKVDLSKNNTIQIAVLGLGGGGKSTLLNILQGKLNTKAKPTIGFRPISMMLTGDTKIRFYDLGGGKKIREIWNQYYHDVHGIIYVVDGTTKQEDMDECIELFNATVNNEFVRGKPLLVLANKQDIENAMPAQEWAQMLHAPKAASRPASPSTLPLPDGPDRGGVAEPAEEFHDHVQFADTSAFIPDSPELQETYEPDPRIEGAIEWLLQAVVGDFDTLNERVKRDSAKKTAEEAQKKIAKERKVLKNKIAQAHIEVCNPEYVTEMQIEPEPENIFSEEEGLEYLASEIGEDVAGLPEIGRQVAFCVGYQKLALTIIGGLKAPVSKKKTPMEWTEILEMVTDLRRELNIVG